MIFLVFVPVIVIIIQIIVVAASACSGGKRQDIAYPKMPDGEEYKNVRYPKPDYPDISDQLDDRLTNIVKNPFEGIL